MLHASVRAHYEASPHALFLALHYFWSLDSFFVLATTSASVQVRRARARAYLLSLPNIILLPAAVPSDLNLGRAAAMRCVAGEGERRGVVAREERRDRQRAPRFASFSLPPSLRCAGNLAKKSDADADRPSVPPLDRPTATGRPPQEHPIDSGTTALQNKREVA